MYIQTTIYIYIYSQTHSVVSNHSSANNSYHYTTTVGGKALSAGSQAPNVHGEESASDHLFVACKPWSLRQETNCIC